MIDEAVGIAAAVMALYLLTSTAAVVFLLLLGVSRVIKKRSS